MKLVKRVLQKGFHKIVTVNRIQFGFMPERGTIDAVFILRSLQQEYHAKGKSCMSFVDPEKPFERVLEWTMKKKGIP